MARSSVTATNSINERSLYIHNHEALVSKDCVNPSCEYCWLSGPNCYAFLFGVCSSSGNNSSFWTSSPKRPFMEKILGSYGYSPWLFQLRSEETSIWTLEKRIPVISASTVGKSQHGPENQLQTHLLFTTITRKVLCSCRNSW